MCILCFLLMTKLSFKSNVRHEGSSCLRLQIYMFADYVFGGGESHWKYVTWMRHHGLRTKNKEKPLLRLPVPPSSSPFFGWFPHSRQGCGSGDEWSPSCYQQHDRDALLPATPNAGPTASSSSSSFTLADLQRDKMALKGQSEPAGEVEIQRWFCCSELWRC